MRKRISKYQSKDGSIILIEENEPPKNMLQRLLKAIGGMIGWGLALTPGLWITIGGAHAIYSERLTAGKFQSTSIGFEAIGWGWIFVAVGLWALGEGCYLKTERSVFRLTGGGLAIVALIIGVFVLVTGLVLKLK